MVKSPPSFKKFYALFDNLMNHLFARSNRRIGNNMVKFPFNLFIDVDWKIVASTLFRSAFCRAKGSRHDY